MAKVNPIQLQKHLKGGAYPANKDDLVQHVKQSGVDQEMCALVERLPDEQYDTPAAVSKAVGEVQ